jgi:diadenosine tetraphosphatase ApaH/serine/threonine PP2A family protein phosphatase
VGYGPNPNECVQAISQQAHLTIMGNHDHAVLGLTDIDYFNQYAKAAVLWTREEMTAENVSILETYPFQHSTGDVLFVHSTPVSPERWDYIFNPLEGKYYLHHLEEMVCFIGHSHQPLFFEQDHKGHIVFDRKPEFSLALREGCKYIVNVGSVGQPRDGDTRTSFAVYDTDMRRIEVRRLPYDFKTTQKKMHKQNLPAFLIERLAHGR